MPARGRFFFEQKVADYMTAKVTSLSPNSTLRDAGDLFDRHDFNSLPVMDGEKLLGVISKFDFMRVFAFTEAHPIPDYEALMKTPVRGLIHEKLATVTPGMPLTRVLQRMVELRTRSFPVIRGDRLVGIISREDIIRALNESTVSARDLAAK